MKTLLTAALAGAGSLLLAGTATAAPVSGGITAVEVTIDLEGAGITPGLIGDAALAEGDGLTVLFPITGGDLEVDPLSGTIEHEGSGLTLSAGGATVELTDFIVNATTGFLSGNVAVVGGDSLGRVDIFSLSNVGDLTLEQITDTESPAISLLVTAGAAQALEGAFGLVGLADLLTGAEFGLAATAPFFGEPDVVPLPAAALFFATGAGLFAARRRAKA